MAQNTTVTIPAQTWTEMTNSNITSVTFQNVGNYQCSVKATTGSAPSTLFGAVEYDAGQGERNVALSSLFPGVAGAVRLWAYSDIGTSMMVSHA